jgi:hypothetical protein
MLNPKKTTKKVAITIKDKIIMSSDKIKIDVIALGENVSL